jgi:uncharacterized membrane protein YoaK (UPF0700 family)
MASSDLKQLPLAATIILTYVTGVVDAVGFLGLDWVFTGNMTGNIVILGMGVAGADELPVLGPAVALATFTAGAFAAGLVLRHRVTSGWHDRITVLLTMGGVVLLALAVLSTMTGTHLQIALAAATAAVMGEQAVVARALAVKDMTTVVVTSTLASLAGETWTRGAAGAVANRRVGAIVVIFLGAITGAVLLQIHMAAAFGLAATLTFLVAIVGHLRLHEKLAHATKTDVRGRTVLRLR